MTVYMMVLGESIIGDVLRNKASTATALNAKDSYRSTCCMSRLKGGRGVGLQVDYIIKCCVYFASSVQNWAGQGDCTVYSCENLLHTKSSMAGGCFI